MAGQKRWLKAPIAGVAAKSDLKIGDLVLAKVKGFPAWPAKISDPEDWGISPDSHKIFVHYFGTNQIGFCKKSELTPWNQDAKRSVQEKSKSRNATADYCLAAREILEVDEKRSSEVNFVDTGQINTDEQSGSRVAERSPSITSFGVRNSGGLRDGVPEDNFINTGQINTDGQSKSRIIERTPNIILFKRVKSRTARSANRVLETENATDSDCGDKSLTSGETPVARNGCSLGTQQVKLSSGDGNNSMECLNGDAKVQETLLVKNQKIVINYQKRSSRLVKCSSFVQGEKEDKNSHLGTGLCVSTGEADSSHFDDANKDNTFREMMEITTAENTTMDSELIVFGRESNAKNEDETKLKVGLAEIPMDFEHTVFGREANAKNEDEAKVKVGLAEIPVDSELVVFGREANAKNGDETNMKVGLAEIPRDIIPFRRRNFRKRKYTSWMQEQDADNRNDERASTEGAKVARIQESMDLPENMVSKVGDGITKACLPVDDSVDTGLLKFCRRANLGHRNANKKIGSVEISESENPPKRSDLRNTRISSSTQGQTDVLGAFCGTHISDNQVQKRRRTESLEQRNAGLDQASTGEKTNYIEFNEQKKSQVEMKTIKNPCVSDQLLDLDRNPTVENIGTNGQLATCDKLGSHIVTNTLNFEPCDEKRVPAKASMNSDPLEAENDWCGLNCDDIIARDVRESSSLTKENRKGEMKTNEEDSDIVGSEVSDMGNIYTKQENLHHASKFSGLHVAIEHKKEAISTTEENRMEQDADNLKEKGASAEGANVPQNQESMELREGMVLKATTNSKACFPVNGSVDIGLVKFRRRTISRYQNVNSKMGSVEISDSENPRQRPDSRKSKIAGSIQDSCVSNKLLNLDVNPAGENNSTNAQVAEICDKLSFQSTVNTQNFESCVEKRVTPNASMNSEPFENDKDSFRLHCDDIFNRDAGENPSLAKENQKGEMKTIVEGSGSEVTVMKNTCTGQETLHHGPKCSGVPASNEQMEEAVSAIITDQMDEEADNVNDMRASTEDAKIPQNQECMELPEVGVSKAGTDIKTSLPMDVSVDIGLVRFHGRANSGYQNVNSKINSVEISVRENPPKRLYLRNTRSSGSIQDQKDNLGALCRAHMSVNGGRKRRRSGSLEQRDVGSEQTFAGEQTDCIKFNDLSESQVEIQTIMEDPSVSDQLKLDRNPTVEDSTTNAQLAETLEQRDVGSEQTFAGEETDCIEFNDLSQSQVQFQTIMEDPSVSDQLLNLDRNPTLEDSTTNAQLAETFEKLCSNITMNTHKFESCDEKNVSAKVSMNSEPLEDDNDLCVLNYDGMFVRDVGENSSLAKENKKGEMEINEKNSDVGNICTEQENMQATVEDTKEAISATEEDQVEQDADNLKEEGISAEDTKVELPEDVVSKMGINITKRCLRSDASVDIGRVKLHRIANSGYQNVNSKVSSIEISDSEDPPKRPHLRNTRSSRSIQDQNDILGALCRTHMPANRGRKRRRTESLEQRDARLEQAATREDTNCIELNELKQSQVEIQTIMEDPCISNVGRNPIMENTGRNAKLAEVCERLSTHITTNTQYFEYCDERRVSLQALMNSKPLEDDKDSGGLNCDDMFARDAEETPLAKENPKGEMKTNEEVNGIMGKNCIEQENLHHTANEQMKKAVTAAKVDQMCCEETQILRLDSETARIEELKQSAVLSTLLKPETALLDSDVWHNTSKEIEEGSSNRFDAFSVNALTVPSERNVGVDSCCVYNSEVDRNDTPEPNGFEKREASEVSNKLNEKDSQNLQSAAIMPQFNNFQDGSTADEDQLDSSRDGLHAGMQTQFSVQSEDINANDASGCFDWTVQTNSPNMAQETLEENEMQGQQSEPAYDSLNDKEAMHKDEKTGVMEANALKQTVKQTRLSPAAMPLESWGCIHIVENLDPSDDDGNLERQGTSVLKELQQLNKQLTSGQTGLNSNMKLLKQTEMVIEKDQSISHLKESTKLNNEGSASQISTLKIKGDEFTNRVRKEIDVDKEAKHQILTKNGDVSACSSSMRYLIAVAQAKRQAKILPVSNLCQNDDLEKAPSTPSSEGVKYSDASTHTTRNSAIECIDEEKIVSRHLFTREDQKAVMARSTLEAMLRTLTRTKESISKATRHAVECVKLGIAQQAIELIVRKLELESSYSRRIDLFFLIDSITQCSHQAKGIEATIYPSAVQNLLPRLLKAAAPPGIIARENRRQCLKVLRIWLQRRVMPEAILKPFIGELEAHSDAKVVGKHYYPPRCQRSVDDPIREMEGMQVDEYGSNATFSLPGLLSQLRDDEEDVSDGVRRDGYHSLGCIEEEIETTKADHKSRKYNKHILEDVDGELEMEVSPSSNGHGGYGDCETSYYGQYPPLPPMPCPSDILPLSPPPLPLSPPPSTPPPPPPPPSSPPNMAASTYYHSVHTSANSVFPSVNQPQYAFQSGSESGYSFRQISPFTVVSSSVTGSHVEQYSQPHSTASNSSMPTFRTALNPFFRVDSASYAQPSINQSLHVNQEVSSQCIQSPQADRDYPSTSFLSAKAKPWQISQVDSRSFYHQMPALPRGSPNITRGTSIYRHDQGSSYGQYDDHFSHVQLRQQPQPIRGATYKPQQGVTRQGYWRPNGNTYYN